MYRRHPISTAIMMFCLCCSASGQTPVNYDESKVPKYTLPDPLILANGQRVADAATWRLRRAEILHLFETNVYGRSPVCPKTIRFETRSVVTDALGGKATRKQITIFFTDRQEGPKMDLLLYVPNAAKKPVPVFLGLNFGGNQCVDHDPGIEISKQWMRNDPNAGIVNERATETSRGCQASRWQVAMLMDRGYALATAYYGDLEPDHPDGWKTGIRDALSQQGKNTIFKPDDWGAIGAWAWGLSRAMDYLQTDPDVNAKSVAVVGHSRLGKTALWAGAQDERFALVISNDSGCGGAALSKRVFGETVETINKAFPHWFCGNFKRFSTHEDQLPVDQHMLIALIAPRPVYVASAAEDLWADPRGEFLGAKGADPVYRLLGATGLSVKEMPPVDQPANAGRIGYHIRRGKHDQTEYDWRQYLDYADRQFQHGPQSR